MLYGWSSAVIELRPLMAIAQENGNANQNEKEVNNPPSGKKPYQDPAFRYEKVFETMALSCGKIEPTSFSCIHKRMSS